MKIQTLVLAFMSLSWASYSQNTTSINFLKNPTFTYLDGMGGLVLNLDNQSRYNSFFYNDYKINGLQVISTHQPEVQQDLVYYIDQDGNTLYRSYAPTAPINMGLIQSRGRDSLNPYGARDFGESLFTGVLNTLFSNKRIRFISR